LIIYDPIKKYLRHFNSPEATKVRETTKSFLVKPLEIKTYTDLLLALVILKPFVREQ
jgi:quinol monooxygenase YgiN